jgi:hypothetical protein
MNYNSYGEGWYQFLDILLILIFQEDIYKEKLFLMAVKSKALETEDQQFLENFREKIVKHKQPLLQPFIKSKM